TALAGLARTLEDDDLARFRSTLLALAASPEGAVRHDWGALLRELIGQLERRQTGNSLARKREALERVLRGFGSDAQLFDKLRALARRWSEVVEPARRPPEVSCPASAGAGSGGAADAALSDALLRLVGLLADNIGELVEDDRSLAAQVATIHELLAAPASTERVAEAERRFRRIFYKRGLLKRGLLEAKTTLMSLVALFAQRLSDMTESATGYHGRMQRYTERLHQAEDVAVLGAIVTELVADTRGMQLDMRRYRDEMMQARRHADDAAGKVRGMVGELERLSARLSLDPLTGALNRRGLDDALRREMARAQRRNTPLCVGVLDLDQLGRLDHRFGRQVAEEALLHVLNIVKVALRPTDLVARRGGEALIVLFSDTASPQAALATRRLQGELGRSPFLHDKHRLPIGFSAGIAQFRSNDTDEGLLARAERAVRRARLHGGNRIVEWDSAR
ncbi:MAG TPA: GGDEF domain-containing protein, partial [Burkholderiales bacterium]|nr:GGDEF domain-containing protein [Burkholderiales bacterium]